MSTQNMQLGKVTILVTDEALDDKGAVRKNQADSPPIKNAWVTLKRLSSSGSTSQTRQKTKQEAPEEPIEELSCEETVYRQETDENGLAFFEVPYGVYEASCKTFGKCSVLKEDIRVGTDSSPIRQITVPLNFTVEWGVLPDNPREDEDIFNMRTHTNAGATVIFKAFHDVQDKHKLIWAATGGHIYESDSEPGTAYLNTQGYVGEIKVSATLSETNTATTSWSTSIHSKQPPITNIDGNLNVALKRTETSFTEDTAFWTGIRNSTEALSFNNYFRFMEWIFCGGNPPNKENGFEDQRFFTKQKEYEELKNRRFLPFSDSDAYRVVKAATEAFVMVNCGVQHDPLPFDSITKRPNRDDAYLSRRDLPVPTETLSSAFKRYLVPVNGDKTLPYLAVIRRKLPDLPIKNNMFETAFATMHGNQNDILDNCYGILQDKLVNPCMLELIWSYWHEEGMLVQSLNAITRRFQNIRAPANDQLANLEMDALRPLNNILWTYIQDEQHRLTVNRRNYEYDHHYGLRLEGKAIQNFRPADTRSKFLEAFHHLLRLCTVFYKQDDDTTVKADAFPVLNALKEVHLILSQGAHNQFGDLPSTSRIEMLMQQWLLARPELGEFLPTRTMVAYPEPWMDRVDAMKKLQGWTDTSVLHFRNLAMFGEQLLLSIRWGHWSDEFEPVKALNWARFFRPQVQGYIHAYRAATGVDLSADPTVNARVDSTLPSLLLQKRLATQKRAV
jgi:hypothetical protein